MDIPKLKAVLAVVHPFTALAYDADHALAAAQLHAENIVRNRTSMTGREVAAEIVDAEYDALTDAKKAQIIALTAHGDIDPFGFAANVVKNVFGVDSETVAALAVARVEMVSQALAESLGDVRAGDVQRARKPEA
jgi:hypothetical protein